jgi:hypothetical protein
MAVHFEFVNAFICDRLLTEKDNVNSAIRIVDIFFVPEGTPEDAVVQFYAVVLLKTLSPTEDDISVKVTLIGSTGRRDQLPDPPEQPYRLNIPFGDPSIPSGITFAMQCNVRPKTMGTAFLEVEVNGIVVAKIPFTLRRPPKEPKD